MTSLLKCRSLYLHVTPKLTGKAVTLILCCFLCSASLLGQSRSDLEAQRKQLLQEIELTTNLLERTKANKEATLDRFIALQNQIRARELLIQNLRDELQMVDSKLGRTQEVIISLEDDLSRLQTEYSHLMRHAFRQQKQRSELIFLLSSKSVADAFYRWQYLKQYERYRKKQAKLILDTQVELSKKLVKVKEQRIEKEALLGTQEDQKSALLKEFLVKNELLQTLKNSELKLKGELKKQQEAHQRLNLAIENVIQKEIERTTLANRTATEEVKPSAKPTIDRAVVSSAFKDFRGNLVWPVSSAVVTKYFGKQPHPTIKNITITNNGIDLLTKEEAEVKAVFTGKVVGKQFVPGHHFMVIINHGKYYTVYSNLEYTFVDRGETIKQGEVIGTVKKDPRTQKSELHFELWYQKSRLNPIHWLKKK